MPSRTARLRAGTSGAARCLGLVVSSRPLALAALTALACTSTAPPPPPARPAPPPAEPAPEPAPEPEPAPPPADPVAVSTLPWVWYHAYPARLADAFSQVGTGPVAHDHIVGDRRRYTAHRDDQGVELVRERVRESWDEDAPELAWRRRVTPTVPVLGEPVVQTMMSRHGHVVVALRIAGGYERHTLREDGTPDVSTIVLDPRGFDGRAAALQLGGTPDRPTVYVRAADRAYLDELDPESGRLTARASFGPEVLAERFAWPPPAARSKPFGRCWPARAGGCLVLRRGGEALELRALDPDGQERWRTALDPRGGTWWTHGVVLEHGDVAIAVVHHGSATGGAAYGVDVASGALRFTASPGGIGNIGHSRYGSEVAAAVGDDGLVRVHGHESGGDYLGVLDPAAGRLRGREVWRP